MADRIIKGDSGNDVVIQNNAGSRKIEVTNSGDVEVTGDVKTTTVKATNLKANDGTASLEIADSTGDIGFSGNTNLKIKLPSAGGIYESNGSTEVLTESSGVAKLGALVVGSVPVGSIFQMAFTPDSTWLTTNEYLICDGSTLNSTSDTQYADLYSAIGTTWGGSSASAFNIPDLKGSYLRGVGASTVFTQDSTITLGQTINDAFQGHRHTFKVVNDNANYSNSPFINVDKTNAGSDGTGVVNGRVFDPITDGSNGTPRTANETRPNSRGVQYIIKF